MKRCLVVIGMVLLAACGGGNLSGATATPAEPSQTPNAATRYAVRETELFHVHSTQTVIAVTQEKVAALLTQQAPTHTPYPTFATTGEGLSREGPWLLFTGAPADEDRASLWLADVEGHPVVRVETGFIWQMQSRPKTSPDDEVMLAFTSEEEYGFGDIFLTIMTLPNLTVIKSLKLNHEPIESLSDAFGPGMSWSPDGRWLAFNAQLDSPSEGLYVYDMQTGITTFLTEGHNGSGSPRWSPDSQYIAYVTGGVLGASSPGPGKRCCGVFFVRPDTPGVVRTDDSGDGDMFGWVSNTEVAIYSGSQYVYDEALRIVNAVTLTSYEIGPHCFSDMAFSMVDRAAIIRPFQSSDFPECDGEFADAPTLIADDKGNVTVLDRAYYDLAWTGIPGLFAADDGVFITLDGQEIEGPPGLIGYAGGNRLSPDGSFLFWPESGIYSVEDSRPVKLVLALDAREGVWSKDGKYLAYNDGDIRIVSAPEFGDPMTITGGTSREWHLNGYWLVWVSP